VAQLPLFDDVRVAPTLRAVADTIRAGGVEALVGAERRADAARYQEVQVRSALARAAGMPFRWSLNPYRGCTHGCEYCYARKYQRHLELGAGDAFASVIFVKRNLPDVLARELRRPGWQHDVVAVGTATDPYQPIEGRYRITRACLACLVDARTPFSLVTKGPMVVRDLDLLVRATAGAGCRVFMSVPSVDADACALLEPGTAAPAQRLRALRQVADAGVPAAVLMMPLVAGVTTSRSAVERTVTAIREAGLPLAGADVARLDPGVREHFFGVLERSAPALLEGYRRLYARSRAPLRYVDAVKQTVRDAARRAGLAAFAGR
jgi:DNA repair photolyase